MRRRLTWLALVIAAAPVLAFLLGLAGAHAQTVTAYQYPATSGSPGSLTVSDGTHSVSGATSLTVSGGTVGGTSPSATLTITGGGGGTTVAATQTASFGPTAGDFAGLTSVLYPASAAGSMTVTIPTNASQAISVGNSISIQRVGAGTVSIAAAGGVTLDYPSDTSLSLRAQQSVVTLTKTGTNEWSVYGDLTPTTTTANAVPYYSPGRPALASFSWINQGSATAAEITNGPIVVTVPMVGSENNRLLVQNVPSAPWTLTAQIQSLLVSANYNDGGLVLTDGTKLIKFDRANTGALEVNWYNSVSSFNAGKYAKTFVLGTDVLWFRIYNDNTNVNYQISTNGALWTTLYSEAKGAFLTISQAGLVFSPLAANTNPASLHNIRFFELASGTGTNVVYQ